MHIFRVWHAFAVPFVDICQLGVAPLDCTGRGRVPYYGWRSDRLRFQPGEVWLARSLPPSRWQGGYEYLIVGCSEGGGVVRCHRKRKDGWQPIC